MKKIVSIFCGLGIMITTILMIIEVKNTAISFQMHPEASLGVPNAVQLTVIMYGTIICVLALILVLLNVFNTRR